MPPTGKRRSLIGRKRSVRKDPVSAQETTFEAQESEGLRAPEADSDTRLDKDGPEGAPGRGAPPTPPVNAKATAIAVVLGLALIGGTAALGLFFGAAVFAAIAGSAGEESMVITAEPVPEVAPVSEVVEDVEEELVEDEVLAEPEVDTDAEAVDQVALPSEPASGRAPNTTIMRVETKAERRERKKKKQ